MCAAWAHTLAGCVGWQSSGGAGRGSEAGLRSVSVRWPINHSQPAQLQRLKGARCARTRWSWCHPESPCSRLSVDRRWTQRVRHQHRHKHVHPFHSGSANNTAPHEQTQINRQENKQSDPAQLPRINPLQGCMFVVFEGETKSQIRDQNQDSKVTSEETAALGSVTVSGRN